MDNNFDVFSGSDIDSNFDFFNQDPVQPESSSTAKPPPFPRAMLSLLLKLELYPNSVIDDILGIDDLTFISEATQMLANLNSQTIRLLELRAFWTSLREIKNREASFQSGILDQLLNIVDEKQVLFLHNDRDFMFFNSGQERCEYINLEKNAELFSRLQEIELLKFLNEEKPILYSQNGVESLYHLFARLWSGNLPQHIAEKLRRLGIMTSLFSQMDPSKVSGAGINVAKFYQLRNQITSLIRPPGLNIPQMQSSTVIINDDMNLWLGPINTRVSADIGNYKTNDFGYSYGVLTNLLKSGQYTQIPLNFFQYVVTSVLTKESCSHYLNTLFEMKPFWDYLDNLCKSNIPLVQKISKGALGLLNTSKGEIEGQGFILSFNTCRAFIRNGSTGTFRAICLFNSKELSTEIFKSLEHVNFSHANYAKHCSDLTSNIISLGSFWYHVFYNSLPDKFVIQISYETFDKLIEQTRIYPALQKFNRQDIRKVLLENLPRYRHLAYKRSQQFATLASASQIALPSNHLAPAEQPEDLVSASDSAILNVTTNVPDQLLTGPKLPNEATSSSELGAVGQVQPINYDEVDCELRAVSVSLKKRIGAYTTEPLERNCEILFSLFESDHHRYRFPIGFFKFVVMGMLENEASSWKLNKLFHTHFFWMYLAKLSENPKLKEFAKGELNLLYRFERNSQAFILSLNTCKVFAFTSNKGGCTRAAELSLFNSNDFSIKILNSLEPVLNGKGFITEGRIISVFDFWKHIFNNSLPEGLLAQISYATFSEIIAQFKNIQRLDNSYWQSLKCYPKQLETLLQNLEAYRDRTVQNLQSPVVDPLQQLALPLTNPLADQPFTLAPYAPDIAFSETRSIDFQDDIQMNQVLTRSTSEPSTHQPRIPEYIKLLQKLISGFDLLNQLQEHEAAFQRAGALIHEVIFDKKTEPLHQQLMSQSLQWQLRLDHPQGGQLILSVVRKISELPATVNDFQKKLILAAFIEYFNIDQLAFTGQTAISFKKSLSDDELMGSFKALGREYRQHQPIALNDLQPLEEEEAREACYTLIQMKKWEFEILQKTGHWGKACQGEVQKKPLFLMVQDATYAKLLPYEALMRGKTLLGLGHYSSAEAETLLQQHIQLEDGLDLTFEQLKALKNSFEQNKEQAPLILPRFKFDLTNEDVRKEKKRKEREASPEDKPTKRVKSASPVEFMNVGEYSEEIEEVPGIVLTKPTYSQNSQSNDSAPSSSSSGSKPIFHYRAQNQFRNLDSGEGASSEEKRRRSNDEDYIKPSQQQKLTNSIERTLTATSLDDLYLNIGIDTLDSTAEKVRIENGRFAFLDELKPLESPLVTKLAELAKHDVQYLPCLPILKPYQDTVLAKLLRLEAAGINALLAMEMGTGKSLVMLGRILRDIASGKFGDKIVLLPVSVLGNFENEALRALYESKSHAAQSVMSDKDLVQNELKGLLGAISDYFTKERTSVSKFSLMYLLRFYALAVEQKKWGPVTYHTFIKPPFVDSPEELLKLCTGHLEFQSVGTRHNSTKLENAKRRLGRIKDRLNNPAHKEICDRLIAFFDGSQQNIENVWAPLAKPVQNPEELLYLVGALLNMHVLAYNHKPLDIESAKRILQYPFDSIMKVESKAGLVTQLEKKQNKIIITSHGLAKGTFEEQPTILNSASIVMVDEAQAFHTPKTKNAIWLESVGRALKEAKIPLWLISATPCENNYQELLQLMNAANPDFLSKEHLDPLGTYYQNTITQVGRSNACSQAGKNPQRQKTEQAVLYSFAHFTALLQLVQQTVLNIKKHSKDVIEAWDGQVATPNYVVLHQNDLPVNCAEEIKRIEQGKNHLDRVSATHRILFGGGALENLEAKKNREFVESLKADREKLRQFVAQSPQLKAILESPQLEQAIRENKKILFIISNLIVGEIGMLALADKFGIGVEQCKLFYGELNGDERTEMVQWFKMMSHYAKALFLSIGAGGVGLNLPETDILFDLSTGYNPAEQQQAQSRALRVGHGGEKTIVSLFFKTVYLYQHTKVVCDLKEKWYAFLLDKKLTHQQRFDLYKEILVEENRKSKLNDTINVKDAADHAAIAEQNLHELFDSLAPDTLLSWIKRAEIKSVA